MRSHSYGIQIDKLQAALDAALEKEETLQKALEIKDKQSETIQVSKSKVSKSCFPES